MRKPIAYVYRVQPRARRCRRRWELAVVPPRGRPNVLTSYATRGLALAAAHILAGARGTVEVMA